MKVTNVQPSAFLKTVWVLALCVTQPDCLRASDFAVSVVEYVSGTGIPNDALTGIPFNDPTSALGAPTVDTTGDGFILPPDAALPVLPVHPAFRQTELVSIGENGHLTLAFDHPVLDDPANPYGLDLLVFGNTSLSITQPSAWNNDDPSQVLLGPNLFEEPGNVAVSADGTNWFLFSSTQADTFAPTLGRVYDTNQPASLPGSSNLWWGAPTDPTLPLDPAIQIDSFTGRDLAYTTRAYGHSAGGTGFDISSFSLPIDPDTGHKYIRYVRITHAGETATPEIDAVADVSPRSSMDLWTLSRFTWQQRAEPAISGPYDDPDHDYLVNLWEYALGTDPHEVDGLNLVLSHTMIEGNPWILVTYRVNSDATELTIRVESGNDLLAWTSEDVIQNWSSSSLGHHQREITAAVPATNTTTFIRLVLNLP